MQLFGIHTKLIELGDNIVDILLEAIHAQRLAVEDGDLLAIASKVIATTQGRFVRLDSVQPSEKAEKLAEEFNLEPSYAEVVLREAKAIFGGVPKALLTLTNNILIANAGVDHKNAPRGYVALWPKDPHGSAEQIRKEIFEKAGKRVGVLVIDSRVTPLRMGTTGLAIGIAGFKPVRDCRTWEDLYGKPLSITRHALADDLASAAHLIMGEADEMTPAVLIKNAPITLSIEVDHNSALIPAEECLYTKLILGKRIA